MATIKRTDTTMATIKRTDTTMATIKRTDTTMATIKRTDTTMATIKRTKWQTLHTKLMIEQHKSHQKPGVNSGVPLMAEDRVGVGKR